MTNQTATSSVVANFSSPLVPHKRGDTGYFQKGDNPKLLILSGMHGDEYEVSEQLIEYVMANAIQLPDFLFIPHASPSATGQKSRVNAYGNDLNRTFASVVTDEEAKALVNILNGHQFTLCLDFHEDCDRYKSFYLYDSGELSDGKRHKLAEAVHAAGFSLYTGIDDEADANLGYMIREGYISTPPNMLLPNPGFLSRFLLSQAIVKRMFTLEVPGKADPVKKGSLVEKLFSFFLSQGNGLS